MYLLVKCCNEAVEDVLKQVDVLNRPEGPFCELGNRVSKIADLVVVCLELRVELWSELLDLNHQRGQALGQVAQTDLLQLLSI